MSTEIICWGHNPGQRYVKDSFSLNGKRKDTRPYPAVIAPWARSDDTGLTKRSKDLVAQIGSALYIGGAAAERLPLANRQQATGRLDLDSPIYQALAQMSAQHTGLIGNGRTNGHRPTVLIAAALPVAWRLQDAAAEERLRTHLRRALGDMVTIREIVVQSEPNAVVGAEILDDDGQLRSEAADLAKGLICVGDIGGGTLNRSVLEQLRALPGQAASPALGSGQVVQALMQQAGVQYLDAERRLETAAATPGSDRAAEALLKQYREAVISHLQEAWRGFSPVAYLFAGGTVHWVADALRRAFPRVRIAANAQQAIAIGLWRYARRKATRGA